MKLYPSARAEKLIYLFGGLGALKAISREASYDDAKIESGDEEISFISLSLATI